MAMWALPRVYTSSYLPFINDSHEVVNSASFGNGSTLTPSDYSEDLASLFVLMSMIFKPFKVM